MGLHKNLARRCHVSKTMRQSEIPRWWIWISSSSASEQLAAVTPISDSPLSLSPITLSQKSLSVRFARIALLARTEPVLAMLRRR